MRSFPPSTATPLRGGPVLRWGILAPGTIAADFTRTLHRNTDQRVHAVASRSAERAARFAAEFGVGRSYAGYERLVADPGIDIVYVAAPHSEHLPLALLAIAAGKHVLVEKPIGLDAGEARRIRDAAQAAGVFAMEAMWSRFLPQTTVIAAMLRDGLLGEVGLVTADFGSSAVFDPANRHFDPALGGGPLLDIGIYPIWFSHFVLGAPSEVTVRGSLASTGVEDHCALLLGGPSGAQSMLSTSFRVPSPMTATIGGTLARLEIESPFIAQGGFAVSASNSDERDHWADQTDLRWRDGLAWQAAAVATEIAEGRLESALHPLEASVRILETIDEARRQLGVRLSPSSD